MKKSYYKIPEPNETIKFECNICGRPCVAPITEIDREIVSCKCGSTVRSRAIIHLLSIELFGESISLPDFPIRSDLCGWGMSDGGYADLLTNKINYVNTFFHRPPYFDITSPLNQNDENILDFLISTEVLEHVAPPVSRAFTNARKLIRPEGFFLISVPYRLKPNTLEHFPELYQYELINSMENRLSLVNTTINGRVQRFDKLVFHDGPGNTLEMRVFSKYGLLLELHKAGFQSIQIFSQPYWRFGIYFPKPWSLPLIARRGSFTKTFLFKMLYFFRQFYRN